MRFALIGLISIASTPIAADDLSITIYGDNRALIEDTRTLSFPAGRKRIELPNVSSQIISPTVTFNADNIGIIEQNFDFDLLSPDKLMEKAVGQTVRIVRTNPATGAEKTERVKVLAVNRGVVIQNGQRIEVLRDDGMPTRVIFDRVPPNLRAQPTLSIDVESSQSGTRDATLTYLSNGLNWRADYVALFDEAAGKMALQGWSTLTNNTDTTFENVKTQLVAGNITSSQNRSNNRPRGISSGSVRAGGTEAGDVERIGDNYLYTLPGRTTIASNQTKQVSFVDADNVDAKKAYEYLASSFQTQPQPQNVDVRIAFSNAENAGLGNPLPAGTIRVYTRDSLGKAQFVGEDSIGHTAGGSDLSLKIGEAFDVTSQATVKSRTNLNRRTTNTTMEYRIRNARPEAATVTLRQFVSSWRTDLKILDENIEHRKPDANSFVWDVDVPAEGETILQFTIQQKRRY